MGGRGSSGGGGGGGGGTPKLQALSGSEKQVAWANDIRHGAFRQLDHMDSEYDRFKNVVFKSDKNPAKSAEDTVGYTKQDVQVLRTSITKFVNDPRASSASFIIDHWNMFSQSFISNQVKEEAVRRKRKK